MSLISRNPITAQTRVTDLNPGTGNSVPQSLVVYARTTVFIATDGATGSGCMLSMVHLPA
ncbi:MAG: hypothetical protein IPL69_20695 [Saprospiraceae bacterium]|nr:hypothetical protein [Candidatus Brachybacter algidus]